jgi:hypothetical protein
MGICFLNYRDMERKTLKFREELAKLIMEGKKDSTWRLFDDKSLSEGDEVDLVNWDTGEKFAEAKLVSIREKKMREVTPEDFNGHEKYESEEDMYTHYRQYYGDQVGPDTSVKIVRFELIEYTQ